MRRCRDTYVTYIDRLKRLTIADIASITLKEEKRLGFVSDDKKFLRKVFIACVKRKIMKNSNIEWVERVLSGIERSEGFIKKEYRGRRMFELKKINLFP